MQDIILRITPIKDYKLPIWVKYFQLKKYIIYLYIALILSTIDFIYFVPSFNCSTQISYLLSFIIIQAILIFWIFVLGEIIKAITIRNAEYYNLNILPIVVCSSIVTLCYLYISYVNFSIVCKICIILLFWISYTNFIFANLFKKLRK